MGQRITIDSASMFNKALEVIETREFFGIDPDRIEVIVHPESLIHSMVGFRDGSILAHMGAPDMRHSIGHALYRPERRDLPVARLDLVQVASLTFRAPDLQRWPALRLAREVMAIRGACGRGLQRREGARARPFPCGPDRVHGHGAGGRGGAGPAFGRKPPWNRRAHP